MRWVGRLQNTRVKEDERVRNYRNVGSGLVEVRPCSSKTPEKKLQHKNTELW